MHIEQACRLQHTFLPLDIRNTTKPRPWRAWMLCDPPFNRNPTRRLVYLAYDVNDILGFAAVEQDSIYAGYRSDLSALYVLPRYRGRGIARALMIHVSRWLFHDGITRMTAPCFAHEPTREFFDRMGGFVIGGADATAEATSIITYGFTNVMEMAGTYIDE